MINFYSFLFSGFFPITFFLSYICFFLSSFLLPFSFLPLFFRSLYFSIPLFLLLMNLICYTSNLYHFHQHWLHYLSASSFSHFITIRNFHQHSTGKSWAGPRLCSDNFPTNLAGPTREWWWKNFPSWMVMKVRSSSPFLFTITIQLGKFFKDQGCG